MVRLVGLENKKRKEARYYTSFKNLGGVEVSEQVFYEEVAKMPLHAVLGYLSSLSSQLFDYPEKDKPHFFHPTRQGKYLNLAIVDDFPSKIPSAEKMYSPGRVPITKGKHLFIHSHNIAYLANVALSLSDKKKFDYELDYELPRRICRLLLITNDMIADKNRPSSLGNLRERHDFVLTWIRLWQFNKYQRWYVPWIKLARTYRLYSSFLPKYFSEAENLFKEITSGIDFIRYTKFLAHFIAYIYKLEIATLWIDKEILFKNIKDKEKLYYKEMLSKWSCTPEEYRKKIIEWKNVRKDKGKQDQFIFDYVLLKEKPLIEALPGKLISPVIEFLIDKITDEPFFIFSNKLEGRTLSDFHSALGLAYEDYANELVENIFQKDLQGRWEYVPRPKNEKGEEIADCILCKNDVCFCFEHKGGRLSTDFILGGKDSERILGPSYEILDELDKDKKIDLADVKKRDKALITEGIWQQNVHIDKVKNFVEKNGNNKLKKIFPVITYSANFLIDKYCYEGYLKKIIQKLGLYNQPACCMPQWLYIDDIETLVGLAEDNKVDLEKIFSEKALKENQSIRFDVFLSEKYQRKDFYNNKLKKLALKLTKLAEKDFLGKE